MNDATKNGLAIVGGGISGLTSAIVALENGQDPSQIHIYESSDRLGGKIQNGSINGHMVNMGAEFIDSNSPIMNLCNKLGVALERSQDQNALNFQGPDGRAIADKDFFEAYAPIEHRIFHDKQEIAQNPDGELARQLNALSFEDYMHVLGSSVRIESERSAWQVLTDWFTGNKNRVNPDIIEAAITAYSAEVGQPPNNISALQFVHEASSQPQEFLASDCAYRVEGGTENIIHAAKAYLIDHGVKEENFHTGAKLDSVAKTGSTFALSFNDPAIGTVQTDKVVMALPAYGLSQVQGLSSIGLSEKAQATIAQAQYTNSVKFMVTVKPETKLPNANFFSNAGFQCWQPDPQTMTFLANADKLGKTENSKELIIRCLEKYAEAHGKKAEELFDISPGNLAFNNPGKSPCYATPRVGQAIALEGLRSDLGNLASGASVVGTFIPGKNGKVGFMDCGVASAQSNISELYTPEKQRPFWLEQTLAKAPPSYSQPSVLADKSADANPAVAANFPR